MSGQCRTPLASFVAADPDHSAASASNIPTIDRLIESLKSLHGGEPATFALIDYGRAAVPALKSVLYRRDPSGIFEPRCRAVKALAGIGAQEALLDFLKAPHDEPDPIARFGEEAVINVTARALIGVHTDEFYYVLRLMACRQLLPGVVEALADFRRRDAIPVLIAALAEDFSRAPAEEGLRKLGTSAREALVEAARSPDSSRGRESPSSLRCRRSALALLIEIGIDAKDLQHLRLLTDEADPTLAFLACKLCVLSYTGGDKAVAVERLISILPHADWFLAGEIEDCLVGNFAAAREFVDRNLRQAGDKPDRNGNNLRFFRSLQRVKARGEGFF